MPKKKAKKKAATKKKATPARRVATRTAGKKKPAPKKAKKGRAVASRRVAKKAAPPKRPTSAKAAPKKAAPKKAAPKKTAKKVIVGKPGVARAKPIQRRDHAGHIDPKYGADLLGKGSREDETDSFVNRPRSSDALVEELGEEFVEGATSAEYRAEDALNQDVTEEVGGPFVETSGGTEFAEGTDPSNPKSATREPFPRT